MYLYLGSGLTIMLPAVTTSSPCFHTTTSAPRCSTVHASVTPSLSGARSERGCDVITGARALKQAARVTSVTRAVTVTNIGDILSLLGSGHQLVFRFSPSADHSNKIMSLRPFYF